ncbi:hypothetical protein, partial [Photobacterium kishitanii]|uniref:hypothetical protein n=1 Tax=Photobacterium kishitanii TaxID=318456 RepID=UPI001A9D6E44
TREARRSPSLLRRDYAVLAIVSNSYPPHQGIFPGITHPSAARQQKKQASFLLPLDLHVLGLPPAFNLSHDQTLQLKFCCFFRNGSINTDFKYLFFINKECKLKLFII